MKLEFPRQIFENPEISNFMKIHPVGAEFLNEDGQTNGRTVMTNLMVTNTP